MTTFIHFFKRLIHDDEICAIPDALLQDIGLSKVDRFSITVAASLDRKFGSNRGHLVDR